jgi:rhodanese-related sulfurtransferase
MFKFRHRKESMIFFIGFACIAGIIAFYGHAYFRKKTTPETNVPLMTSTSFVTDETYISYENLSEKRSLENSNIILIDIRPNELFASEHVPQSTNIPFEIIGELNIKDGFTFILITSAGNEQGLGASAAQILHEKNSKVPLFILRGGFEGWKRASGQTISFGDSNLITDQSKVNYISPEDFKKRLDAKQFSFVIDMRPKDIYNQGHVPNAVNLPFDQLENFYKKIPSGRKIVTYGNSEIEDFQAGVRLFDLGFFSTEVLKGGFASWKDKGFEIQK